MTPDAVVISGMAWSTPLGDGLGEVWARLCAGAGGIASVPSPHRLRNDLAATVPHPPYGDVEPRKRQVDLAARTLVAAFRDAGLVPGDQRVRLVCGTSFGAQLDGPETDGWAAEAAEAAGHPDDPVSVVTACSAGSDSLLVAASLIRGGAARVCVAGGADVLTEAKRLGHSALGTMSPTRLRAFDRAHDGMILGEGAAFLVLESARDARARGARVHAVLRAAASANDAAGLTAPDPSGRSVVAAVRRCLDHAGVAPERIAVVSAHATGTTLNDQVEAASLQEVFGGANPGPVVFGTKGALGHSLGATGAIEAVATVLALTQGRVPPLAGLTAPLPGLSLRLPGAGGARVTGASGLSLTLGFGGFNTCLLFEVPGERRAA
ncbi:beta-ketoacyl synthase N-terminal-like domain-containing protein [Nonomuraea sp. NPDC049480]|uniref:beta-ketoacyl synthase N-terminal-like domain-containing protein n=1 Tax=Nonomuraea sp. NPDC049480 TaxID=3364353 RepID=UPI0037A3A081